MLTAYQLPYIDRFYTVEDIGKYYRVCVIFNGDNYMKRYLDSKFGGESLETEYGYCNYRYYKVRKSNGEVTENDEPLG